MHAFHFVRLFVDNIPPFNATSRLCSFYFFLWYFYVDMDINAATGTIYLTDFDVIYICSHLNTARSCSPRSLWCISFCVLPIHLAQRSTAFYAVYIYSGSVSSSFCSYNIDWDLLLPPFFLVWFFWGWGWGKGEKCIMHACSAACRNGGGELHRDPPKDIISKN